MPLAEGTEHTLDFTQQEIAKLSDLLCDLQLAVLSHLLAL